MHLDEERLQRMIDGELAADELAAAREHLEVCPECSQVFRLVGVERDRVDLLLGQLDQPTRAIELAEPEPEPRSSIARWLVAAALLAALAGAAFAIPGSPVRQWVRQVLSGARHETKSLPPRVEASPAGIAVTPGARMVIDFLATQSAGSATVRIADASELTIEAPNGAATFTSDVDRVVVNNRGAASYSIEVPRAAPFVEIRVGGAPRFRKQGARVTLGVPSDRDVYSVPLARP